MSGAAEHDSTGGTDLLLRAEAITKRFGTTLALDRVDFELRRAEVHALLGENGAGKTTLCNVIAGLYQAEGGRLLLNGEGYSPRTPSAAIAAGVGMVHQHFKLVEPMTVAENLHIGLGDKGWRRTAREMERYAAEVAEEFGLDVDPSAAVWQLSVGQQQRVEILRNLARGAQILILDEPTAVLTETEADELSTVLRSLISSDRSVIYISHKLREVAAVADRVTILRDGKLIDTVAAQDATPAELGRIMTGAAVKATIAPPATAVGEIRLRLDGICALSDRGLPALSGVSLDGRGGQIIGIAGVSGNGQSELAEVMTGLRQPTDGTMHIDGVNLTAADARAIAAAGVGHMPEDRIATGLVKTASTERNAILRHYRTDELSSRFTINRTAARSFALSLAERANVSYRKMAAPVSELSGGNQQKLVARREADLAESVLVAVHPTRGLDVGAAADVLSSLLNERDTGTAVVLISDDLDEVLALADRVLVMYDGEIVGEFDRDNADRGVIGELMGGHISEVAQ